MSTVKAPKNDQYTGVGGAFVIGPDGKRRPDSNAVATRAEAPAPVQRIAPVSAPKGGKPASKE